MTTLPVLRGLKHIGRVSGSAQRTFDVVDQTPFLPHVENLNMWRLPVSQRLIREDLGEFQLRSKIRPNTENFSLAVQRAYELFKLPEKVKMLHLNDVFKQELDIWSKSPGLPWTVLGYKTKGDIKNDPDAVRRVRKFAHLIKAGEEIHFPDCLAYVRSHTCEYGEYKVRAVWGYPATVSFMEAMFALPLIKAYQNTHDLLRPIAYGFETALGGMRKFCKRFRYPGAHFTGIDFKKFDKTVPPWLIDIAFDILMSNINFYQYEDYGVADFRRNIILFYTLRRYFIHTTIRTADGHRYRKFSGIASRSYFTQLIGSIVNTILILWMSLEQFGAFPLDLLTLGDDSFFSSIRKWNLQWCADFVRKIGMEINIIKSDQSESLNNIRFLGYIVGNGQPEKPFNEWMVALAFPERPDREFSDLQNRALGLYYANMCVDREFTRICKTINGVRKFEINFTSNFERMLKHIGVCLSTIDPLNLPDPIYFTKYIQGVSTLV